MEPTSLTRRRAIALLTLAAFTLGPAGFAGAQTGTINPASVRSAAFASGLRQLGAVPAPKMTEVLTMFLRPTAAARTAAIRLGKALFWDMQAGSDGQACASCHFHAGADIRARNQLSPGLRAVPQDTLFGNNNFGVAGFPQFKPDYMLVAADFPFHVVDPPDNNQFPHFVIQDTNDVTSSMGVFAATFTGIGAPLLDAGDAFVDLIFNLDNPSASLIARNVRRVEPRNTPTVINAVFNHSNFWDGRAHTLFNGVSPIGPLDPDAKIWVNNGSAGAAPVQQTVRIPNSSLASQAVGPPTSDLEMSFFARPFPLIGRKLLALTPLGQQLVDPTDSVLGSLSLAPQNGLNTSYAALIQAAFQPKYWNGANVVLPQGTFTHTEANFTLFWGLAIQMYEASLVSNQARFDTFMAGNNSVLTQTQLQGLLVFLNKGPGRNLAAVDTAIAAAQSALGVPIGVGNCVSCHSGPEFTAAAFTSLGRNGALELIEMEEDSPVLVNGFLQLSPTRAIEDEGFSNIGVRPVNDDLGRGGIENGFPLSFVRQALDPNLNFLLPPGAELPCTAGVDCPTRVQVDGAFKIPGLRNVELTGPYFHSGGQAILEQVIEFYDRQSDFGDANIDVLDGEIAHIDLGEDDEGPLVDFLLSLTDERVRQEQAPFDHPELPVPNGGTFAAEEPRIVVPAVGAAGRPAKGLPPLGTFLGLSPFGAP